MLVRDVQRLCRFSERFQMLHLLLFRINRPEYVLTRFIRFPLLMRRFDMLQFDGFFIELLLFN